MASMRLLNRPFDVLLAWWQRHRMRPGMRVGVYIDGFNLYYGGESIMGKGVVGWRWLDMRATFSAIAHAQWAGVAVVQPVVYCTSRILGRVSPSGQKRQDDYLRALAKSATIDHVEYGNFFEKTKTRPIATADRKGRPVVWPAAYPVVIKDISAGSVTAGVDVPDAAFMVTVGDREEKGSDVNVAAHLLIDTLEGNIDAAIVVSNDSDLAFAVAEARKRVPVGVVNPNRKPTAAKLKSRPVGGPAGSWEYQLVAVDLTTYQLPDPCNGVAKPATW
jgi:hypothetical protein